MRKRTAEETHEWTRQLDVQDGGREALFAVMSATDSSVATQLGWLCQWWQQMQSWLKELPVEGRCYFFGFLLLLIDAATWAFGDHEKAIVGLQISFSIFACGLISPANRLYESVWRKPVGKLLTVGVFALATDLSYGVGRQTVSLLIGTNPSPFAGSITLATILLSPLLFSVGMAIGGMFVCIAWVYSCMFNGFMNTVTGCRVSRGTLGLWVCRAVAILVVTVGSYAVLNHSAGYSNWTEQRVAAYLYTFDMYNDRYYAKDSRLKTASLIDGRILLGRPRPEGGYEFGVTAAPIH